MTKVSIFTAMFAMSALSLPALAAPPANKDACLATAFDLADQAAKKKLAEGQMAKVEQALGTLETDCAGDLAKAAASMKAVEDAIAGK